MRIKNIFYLVCILYTVLGYSQNPLENKIFYGTDFHKYKSEIKGKYGDVNCQILKFYNNQVTIYNYNRFIYDTNNFNDTVVFKPKGNLKQKTEPYTINQNDLIIKHPKFKYFILDSTSINAYKNDDFKKLNIPNKFIEISQTQFENLTNNNIN